MSPKSAGIAKTNRNGEPNACVDALRALLRPTRTTGWTTHPVAKTVNNPRHDGPALLAPVEV
ncbi:MAG: hypothetical protein WBG92_13995 [Thiohalocapsa sp.]